MFREIILDTETTGLEPSSDRIVEIAAIEIVDGLATGSTFHALVNPQRPMPREAQDIHGHSNESLRDKPIFSAVVDGFLDFVGSSNLVAHSADFDVGFLNAELARTGRSSINKERVVDTLALAREKHPGKSNSLDALCDRYGISRVTRVRHGALVDAELLAKVYFELRRAAQQSLIFDAPGAGMIKADYSNRPARPSFLDEVAIAAHAVFVKTFGEDSIWAKYLKGD